MSHQKREVITNLALITNNNRYERKSNCVFSGVARGTI